MVEDIAPPIAESKVLESPAEKQRWGEIGSATLVKIVILAGLSCYIFRDELIRLVQDWINDSSWSHGFLIPYFSLYFLNQHRKEILNLRPKPSYLGLFLMIGVLAFYFLNLISPSGYAYYRRVSIIGLLGAMVLFLGGWRLVRYTWLPIGFLMFAIPFPQRYYVKYTMHLRTLSASVAGFLLSLVEGIETSVNGVVIDIVYNGQHLEPKLNVAEACSGMRLLMAFLALGVAMAYLHYRPIWQRLVLLASTIPIAVLCNIVRVSTTGFIYVFIGPQYTVGIYHDTLGIAMLPLAFGLYGLLAWFMSSLFVEDSDEAVENIVIRRSDR
jgi:exosortase